jgi:hypothetical protein
MLNFKFLKIQNLQNLQKNYNLKIVIKIQNITKIKFKVKLNKIF